MNQFDSASRSELLIGNVSDETIVSNILGKYETVLRQTRSIRRQWLVNAAFSRGQQHCTLHTVENRLLYFSPQPGRKRVTDDKIGPWKEHMVANIVSALPEFGCVPNSFVGSDVMAARTGTALLKHYWNEWRFKKAYIELASHLVDFGNAVIYANYLEDGNKITSEHVIDPQTGEPMQDENGFPVTQDIPFGDITVDVLPPHLLFCNQDPSPTPEKPWIMIVPRRSPDYLINKYGEKAKNLSPDGPNSHEEFPITRIARMEQDRTKPLDEINEYIYLQKPCAQEPDGKVIVMAGGEVLYNEKWPYRKLKTYPVVLFQYQPEADEFFARSRIDRQIDLQKALNLVWSILMENYDDMVHLKWLVPNASGIREITDDNAIVRYNYPHKPEQSSIQALPNWALEVINFLLRSLQDVQNYHGASMGTSVAGVRSESQAESLREQDMLPLTTLDEMIKESFAELGQVILEIAAEKLTTPRFISYTNANGLMQIKQFRNTMLGAVPKVQVRLTGTYLRSKDATARRIIEMAQMGLITDSRGLPDTNRILRLMEFAIPESELDQMRIQTEQAYRENDQIMAGQPAQVAPWQNHKVHLDVIEELLNSSEFMELLAKPEENQQIIQLALQHWTETQQAYQQGIMMLSQANSQQQPGQAGGKAAAPKQNNATRQG